MNKPVFVLRGSDPGALMRAVDLGFSLVHHRAHLPGAIGLIGPEHHLPTGRDSAGWGKDIVLTLVFVKLSPFYGGILFVSVVDYARFTDQTFAVGAHGSYEQHRLKSGPAAGQCKRHIGFAVFVPKGTNVDKAFAGFDQMRLRPGAAGIGSLNHVNTEIGIAPVYVIFLVVIAYGRSPNSAAVLNLVVKIFGYLPAQGMPYQTPVD